MNYYDTLYSFCLPSSFNISPVYISILFSLLSSSFPLNSTKKSIILYIQIWYLCKFSRVLYLFSIWCFCLLVPIQITITNYMNNFKVTHGVERRGRCHHAVIPRPARTGPGAVRGAWRKPILCTVRIRTLWRARLWSDTRPVSKVRRVVEPC